MKNMKMGFIVQILKQDGIGIIEEVGTQTRWIYFLDETKLKLKVNDQVNFERDDEYEQFVAISIRQINPVRTRLVG